MQEPWKTDKWFISPWNYLPEVAKNSAFGKNIKIHDVTLRDGEQQTAVVFRREEKVAIAKKLDALGVHRIEAGIADGQGQVALVRQRLGGSDGHFPWRRQSVVVAGGIAQGELRGGKLGAHRTLIGDAGMAPGRDYAPSAGRTDSSHSA